MMYRPFKIYRLFIKVLFRLFKFSALYQEIVESIIKCWRINESYYIGIQVLNFKK